VISNGSPRRVAVTSPARKLSASAGPGRSRAHPPSPKSSRRALDRVALSCCDNFLYSFKGTPSACQAGPKPGRVACGGRGSHRRGSRAGANQGTARSRAGRRGDWPAPGRQPAAPYGRKPTGRGAAAGRLSPLPQAGSPVRNAPTMTAPAELAELPISRRACSRRERSQPGGSAVSLSGWQCEDWRRLRRPHLPGAPRIVRVGPSSVKGT
jgi:hypothetical protein